MANVMRAKISTIQSRLGAIQDDMRRKLIDDTKLAPISQAVDCIRLRVRKTYEGDDISWICESADVISAVFPPLTDVPFRKVQVDPETRSWKLTSLVNAFDEGEQEKSYTLQIPYKFDLDVNDLIFRIFIDPDIKYPIIVALQIQELLGTFGSLRIIQQKAKATIPTEEIPQEIVATIQEMAKRRLKLGW
jgi:hypothetical protein